jgi:hypothetical protein
LVQVKSGCKIKIQNSKFNNPLLSPDDLAFWEKNGYVVIPKAVPEENLRAVVDDIWWFLGMNLDDPDDWYHAPHKSGGMVEMYQTQSLWNNRQCPRVHQAFAEILGTEKLLSSMDRANMKPPVRPDKPDWDHVGMIHWDLDTFKELKVRLRVQGVLYLTDTAENQGGFQCVPGFHNKYEQWIKTQSEDRDAWRVEISKLDVVPIPGRAGDLLIWHSFLPHGNGRNTSNKPRLAQFITMSPVGDYNEEVRQDRINMWRERLPPAGKAFPGDDRHIEGQNSPAELTNLGKKLLGLVKW